MADVMMRVADSNRIDRLGQTGRIVRRLKNHVLQSFSGGSVAKVADHHWFDVDGIDLGTASDRARRTEK